MEGIWGGFDPEHVELKTGIEKQVPGSLKTMDTNAVDSLVFLSH
jgi:hypothetical protein